MKQQFKLVFLALFISIVSCNSDDDGGIISLGDYEDGILVLNEGSQSFGTVSYLSEDFTEVEQEIFTTVNPGENLGFFVQSIFFDDENAYIIANGSNLITVVNRYTFEKIGEFTAGLDVPRYGVVVDGTAYVTNLSSFVTDQDDFVAVIDLKNLSLVNQIPLSNTAEHIIYDGSKLYVQNAAFGFGSGISIINPNTNAIEQTVSTGDALQNIAINANSIYALHANGIDVISTSSQEVVSTITLPADISGATNLRISDGQFYYTFNSSVYSSPLSATTLNNTPFITYESNSAFGTMYGFAVRNGLVYIGDATDFASDGFIEVYDINGNFVFETSVGVGPNGFYFN